MEFAKKKQHDELTIEFCGLATANMVEKCANGVEEDNRDELIQNRLARLAASHSLLKCALVWTRSTAEGPSLKHEVHTDV